MITRQALRNAGALLLILAPEALFARSNSVTAGLSMSYDYNDREYEAVSDDLTIDGVTAARIAEEDDTYSRVVVRPLIYLVSKSKLDQFGLRAAPAVRYDLEDSDTDVDALFALSGWRFITKSWMVKSSDTFVRSDHNTTGTEEAADGEENSTPELSPDAGRKRFWRNTFNIASDHIYGRDQKAILGFDYVVLRNDDSGESSYNDYDMYQFAVKNDYRFNAYWDTKADLKVVRGEFDNNDRLTAAAEPDPSLVDSSGDLMEYHADAILTNRFFRPNNISLSYNYIGTAYDETSRNDGNIHQSRLTWQRDFLERLSARLGAGVSYEKTEEQKANWGGNGIAEILYTMERSSFRLSVEKRYDVDNFSGTEERGFIDVWDASLGFGHQLLEDVKIDAKVTYLYEDRQDRAANTSADDATALEEYNKNYFITGVGLHYSFWQDYSAGINYTFTRLNSERIGEDYDDHRLLLTISWETEVLNW